MQQVQLQYLPYKLGNICQHNLSKANSNFIDIACSQNQTLYHRVSQASKICNKCATIIMSLANSQQNCICCSQKLQQLLNQSWICNHSNRNLDEITIKCINNEKQTHEVPFQKKVCKSCYDKIRASFMFSTSCAVCDQKQSSIFQNMEKTIIQPSYYFFSQLIKQMSNKKLSQEQVKSQIEYFCLADPRNEQYTSKMENQIKNIGQNVAEEHQSKRYQLYPKCVKHRNNFLNLCNNCLVSILNLKCCPYGCPYQKKQNKNASKTQTSFTTETGFLCLYPKQTKDYQYIQYFNIRYKQESNKLDKWQGSLKKIKYSGKQNICNKFALYAASTQLSNLSYFYCGGALGQNIQGMKSSNSSFLINIDPSLKSFTIEDLGNMNTARSSHNVVLLNDCVYVIGGFNKQQKKCLSECQKFDLKTRKWSKIASLNIQRSKPNVLQYKGSIYVLGGISSNPEIWQNQCQRYNIQKNAWQKIKYKGFDNPFVTGGTSLNGCWGLSQIQNAFLVGGSNYLMSTYFFQQIEFKDNWFKMVTSGSEERLNDSRQNACLSLMKTDYQNEKILLVFGGTEQHVPFLSFDAIRLKQQKNQINPIFVYDQVNVGSYRMVLRENAQSAYQYMKDKLIEQGILSKQKVQIKDSGKSIVNYQQKVHLIEKMWYGVGKCLVGFSGVA